MMTNYNHGSFLKARLESILQQLSDDAEIVIVDDASTDESLSVIEDFAKRDPRIRLIQNPKNLGVIAAVNIALNATRGKYIASLAADDKILPGFIEKTLKALVDHPEIAICCSDCGVSYDGFPDKDPSHIETIKLLNAPQSLQVFSPSQLPKIFGSTDFWIPGHTCMIKREALLNHGGFDKRVKFLADWLLLHSIALTGGIAYIPETLSIWRRHPQTYSGSLEANELHKKTAYRQLIQIITSIEDRSLRSLFRKAALLRIYVKDLFWELVWQPKYWDFIAVIALKVIQRRIQRYWTTSFSSTK